MIIWGTKGKKKVVDRGQFFCPRCNTSRHYEHIEVGKYFTLYFLPLFQTSKLGEYIECKICNTPFEMQVLDYNQNLNKELQDSIDSVKEELESGIPVNTIYSGILASGGSEDLANNLISMATNGSLKICRNDQLVYSSSLSFCAKCGNRLTKP